MPGIVAPASVGTGHKPLAAQKTTIASSSVPEPSGSEGHHISTKKSYHPISESHPVQKSPRLKLRKPLSKKARRFIIAKTKKLIAIRNAVDEEVLRAAGKANPSVDDWSPRDRLLQACEHLEEQELRHLRIRTKKLARLERRYRLDPSPDRAYDYNLVRTLLWRFKRNLGPLLGDYMNKGSGENNDSNIVDFFRADLGPDSNLKWSDTSDNEDEAVRQEPVAASPYSHHRKKNPKQEYINLHNMDVTKSARKGLLRDTSTIVGKRKREEEATENTPIKKVRFASHDGMIDETINDKDTGDLASPLKDKIKLEIKEGEKVKGEVEKGKGKQPSIPGETQNNDT
ncbi:hypothetical protein F5Y10DRAFT_106688 [Nemania abortiva]|nr:hypothetical protein F5Y10DRAFT_106688 [Nemania abortiva]